MLKVFINILLLQIISSFSQAATPDSLVYFSDLSFRNKAEKEVYYNLKKVQNDDEMLRLFLYIKPFEDSISIEHSEKILNEFIEQKVGQIKKDDEEKKIKILVDLVNKTFLKRQKEKCYFQETIETGNYNCFTSTAIYTLLLSKLNIPYQLKENTNGFELIAYPEGKKIGIETGASGKKCFEFAEYFRNKWTKSMFYARIIPSAEFEKGYSEELFEKYYFKTSTLSPKQLASIMLCNLSFQAADENKAEEAFNDMQKSYILYPNERNQVTLKYQIFNTLGKYNYENSVDYNKVLYLCRYRNIGDNEITNDLISSEFLRFVTKQLTLKISLKEIENKYLLMTNKINDSLLLSALTYIYNSEIAQTIIHFKTYEVDALNYLESAYKIKPEEQALKSLIFESLNEKIEKEKDATIVLGVVNNYSSKFDYLDKSFSTRTIKVNCYLNIAYKNFMNGKPLEGDENMKRGEQLCTQYGIKPSFESTENSYLSAAKYYYKKGDKLKAKAYLLKGFEYAPDSKLIQDKLKLFN
jgi:hypothetical protein